MYPPPLISCFDDIATKFVSNGYKYKSLSVSSYSLIEIKNELNVFTISVIPKIVERRIVSCFEIKVPMKETTFVTRFNLKDLEQAKEFLLYHKGDDETDKDTFVY